LSDLAKYSMTRQLSFLLYAYSAMGLTHCYKPAVFLNIIQPRLTSGVSRTLGLSP